MKFSRYIFDWCLSVIRNLKLYLKPLITGKTSFFKSGSHLLSHAVSSIVSSAASVLTIVFGMWTGVSPKRIATRSNEHLALLPQCYLLSFLLITQQWKTLYSISLERRWSSRTFRYGYLVTTSPQLSILPSAAPSLRLGHWLRALPTPMVWRAVCTRPGNVFTDRKSVV